MLVLFSSQWSRWFGVLVSLGALAGPPLKATVPVTAGLVLHLESGVGVQTDLNGVVTRWDDQSGRGNYVHGSGDPIVRPNATPSGKPALSLDTSGDLLERKLAVHGITGLPVGNANRTVYLVASYWASTWWAGLSYGRGEANRAFGLTVKHETGQLVLHGWGKGNDLVSTTPGLRAGWLVQSAVVEQSVGTLQRDGSRIASFSHVYNTTADRLVLGQEISGLGHVGMDVAAVLIYDRALNATERASVDAYLSQTYMTPAPVNTAPNVTISAPADGATVALGTTVQLSATAQDQEDGSLTTALLWRSDRDGPLGSGGTIDVSTLTEGTHLISASVQDSRGAIGRAEVRQTVSTSGSDSTRVFFDGTSLRGVYPWMRQYARSDPEGIFTVRDGLLRVAGDEPMAVLVSEEEFSNYVLRLEYTWGSGTYGERAGRARDSGLLIHSRGGDGSWKGNMMASLEVQIMEGSTGDFILLKDTVASPGTAPMRITSRVAQLTCANRTWNCRGGYVWSPQNGTSRTFQEQTDSVHWSGWDRSWKDVAGFRGRAEVEKPPGQWNELIIVAEHDRVEVYLNGVKVNEATAVFPTQGRIQLQSEQAEYFVRRWELRAID